MIKYLLLIQVIILIGCSNQEVKLNLKDTYWTTDIMIDKESNEFTPNIVLSIGDSIASIHQFGTGNKLFEKKYRIEDNELILGKNVKPFLKFIRTNETEILGSLFEGDTTRFKRIYPRKFSESFIKSEIENQSFKINGDSRETIIYFDDKEVFQFQEAGSSDYSHLQFDRIPYSIDFTNSISTLTIGSTRNPEIRRQQNGELELLNLIIGELNVKEKIGIEVTTYKPLKDRKITLSKIKETNNIEELINTKWERGKKLSLNFISQNEAIFENKGETKKLVWKSDNSGSLIFLKDEAGERIVAINNLKKDKNRLGLEISRSKFVDLLRKK